MEYPTSHLYFLGIPRESVAKLFYTMRRHGFEWLPIVLNCLLIYIHKKNAY